MKYGFKCGIWGNIFGVPSIIADNFLKLANESQLKVILYLLRNGNNEYTENEIAKAVGISEDAVKEAIIFWSQANILPENQSSEKSMMTHPVMEQDKSIFTPVKPEKPPIDDIKPKIVSSSQTKFSNSEIATIKEENDEVKAMFSMAESYMGILNVTVQKSLIWMYEYLGLKPDVIIMLISYCVSIGKKYVGYIDTIAYSWYEKGINTHEEAQSEVNRLRESFEFTSRIKRIFEMKRNPIENQKAFIAEWQKMNFSDELLKLAYEKNVEYTQGLSFSYINKILCSWYEQGITTLEQATLADIEFKNSREMNPKKKSKEEKKSKGEEIAKKYEIFTKM